MQIEPALADEARERREAAAIRGNVNRWQNQDEDESPVPEIFPEPGEAREQAAKLTGTNPRYVSDAKRLARESPELADEVRERQGTRTDLTPNLPQSFGEGSRHDNEAAQQAAVLVGTNRQYVSDAKRLARKYFVKYRYIFQADTFL